MPPKLREFFNFVGAQPSSKLQQMLSFYAFAGKLNNFPGCVAERIHFFVASPHYFPDNIPISAYRSLRARVNDPFWHLVL
jgi:hypothetical protein